MPVSLTIIRYRKLFIPFAVIAMAVFRMPLLFSKKISFFKLMGSGKDPFSKAPDLQQWAILTVQTLPVVIQQDQKTLNKILYGYFISMWWQLFRCETFTILLAPFAGHGMWDGKNVFGNLPKTRQQDGPVAVLTRATIRFKKLRSFWSIVPRVASEMNKVKGCKMYLGVGEMPLKKQATFSIWENEKQLADFAYGTETHKAVIHKTRDQQWYSEEMFVRFSILGYTGTIQGVDPLFGNNKSNV